jgi:hypothetical protein
MHHSAAVLARAAVAADSSSSTSGTVITINVSIVDTMSQLVSSSNPLLLVAPSAKLIGSLLLLGIKLRSADK